MMSLTEEDIFPKEIVLALKGLNNKKRRLILSALVNRDTMSYTEIESSTGIKGELSNHLKKLITHLLITKFYEHESGDNYYSYYKITPLGIRMLQSLYGSFYVKVKTTKEMFVYVKETKETANIFGVENLVTKETISSSDGTSLDLNDFEEILKKVKK